MQSNQEGRIEILSPRLLDDFRPVVKELRMLAASLGLEFGWHYLLDLVWVVSHLGNPTGKKLMDAGAGVGILQWYLAEKGSEVISVDRSSRACLPVKFRRRYQVEGYRSANQDDLKPATHAFIHNFNASNSLKAKIYYLKREFQGILQNHHSPGKVLIYNQDLLHLDTIPENTLDAVVSISALEHNAPETLPKVVNELLRVLKPGGILLVTLGAARNEDWFHEPSKGWCYTEETLRKMFDLPIDAVSNFDQYDSIFNEIINCAELRDNLAKFYFQSAENGMPWGIWDPKYSSAGILKIKPAQSNL